MGEVVDVFQTVSSRKKVKNHCF